TSDFEENPYLRYPASALGEMAWDRTQAELEWTGKLGSSVQIRSVAYHHWLHRAWTKFNRFASSIDTHKLLRDEPDGGQAAVYLAILRGEENSVSEDQQLLIGTNDRTFHSFGLQTTAEWRKSTEHVESALEFGVRLHGDHVQRVHTEEPHSMLDGSLVHTGEETITNLDSVATANALALYLHEDLSIGRLHLFPGLRFEGIQTWTEAVGGDPQDPVFRSKLLPGMGVLIEATGVLDVFAGAHQGFSPVAPGQDADIQPEESWNYEAGSRVDLSTVAAEVVGFFNDYSNITGQCSFSGGCSGSDLDRQYNGGAAQVYGVEFMTDADLPLVGEFQMPLKFSYAWTDARFTTSFSSSFPQYGQVASGDRLPYLAAHQASLTVGVDHPKAALYAGLSYRSGMLDAAGDLENPDIDALLTLDASASAQLHSDWLLYVTGSNLTGETGITSWRPYGARPIAPLQIMAGLKWTPSP
ncbi:MAG: TonB-dependent receptor, partial [Myxococcota bacterium]|nr:TonB-dependent receptor [Myxococcota bacterium]